ncbi:MAG: queuosine precursor transporter [Bacteroidetes bacterium]|nr:queuosine precursor transporter [Bacteroidota bacterium]
MEPKKRRQAETIFLILASLFITSLVTSNLIFQKFFSWNPFGWYQFELSVGIIAYPITFLITDIISEIYGSKRANSVVIAGIFASFFALLIVVVSTEAQATTWSPIGNVVFKQVFGFTYIAVGASLAAYLFAQFLDVKVFHFWKRVTHGKHLWIRNNFSTIASQLVDTITILLLLCGFGVIEWELFWILVLNGYLFKVMFALFDTPVIYVMVHFIRKHFDMVDVNKHLLEDN